MKFANYYIFLWSQLYNNQYNFSVRIKNNRYDIISEEDQSKKINPYFILNEKNSLILSNNSYLKKENQYLYVQDQTEEETKQMIMIMLNYYNKLYMDSEQQIELSKIDEMQLEINNFFKNNINNLISGIISLIINLTDKNKDVLDYFKESFSFLEKDTINIIEDLYINLEKYFLEYFIKYLTDISFFCDCNSILWKHKNKFMYDKENYEKYFNDELNNNTINIDEELLLIDNEIKNLDNKSFKELYKDKYDNYKDKLLNLKNILIIYKDRNNEEITILRNEAKELIRNLDYKANINTKNINSIKYLKDNINKFINLENPNREKLKNLENEVNTFFEIEKYNHIKDTISLPNKHNINEFNYSNNKYKLYEFIFWYSNSDNELNKLLERETNEKTWLEIFFNLNKDLDLESIMIFIKDKKLEDCKGLSFYQKEIKQMLRGILLSKIIINKIKIDDLKNFVEELNSKINKKNVIEKEEYLFTYNISNKYSKNLKIIMPFFSPFDAFYLFYKYDKGNLYKLGNVFLGTNGFGEIHEIANEILKKKDYKDMMEISEKIAILFYKSITHPENKDKLLNEQININNNENLSIIKFLEKEREIEKSDDNKKILNLIVFCLEFIQELQEKIYKNQKENMNEFDFKLEDLYKLINNNEIMSSFDIIKKEIENIDEEKKENYLYSPSFIYYINNNQSFINELFENLSDSDISIIYDIKIGKKINYLPFWLYILRNVSSFYCLEYGNKNLDEKISCDIINKIKNKIYDFDNNKKSLNLRWLNLISENIASELLDPNIHLFYKFFNSLFMNLNLSNKNIKNYANNEIKNFYYEIIDYVFEKNFSDLLKMDFKNSNIMKFIKDPSSFLKEKIKNIIVNKFINIIKDEKIIEKIEEDFNDNIKNFSNELKKEIEKSNKNLIEQEFQNLKDKYSKKLDDVSDQIIKYNSIIDGILNKKDNRKTTNKQIFEDEIKQLKRIKNEITKYEKNELKKDCGNNLICYKLNYNFSRIKNQKINLFYKNKLIQISHGKKEGFIYIINNENNEQFKNNFKFEIKEIEEEINEIFEKKENYTINDFINFINAEKINFIKYEIVNEEEIKKLIENKNKMPTIEDVKDPQFILINDYKEEDFFINFDKLNKSLDNLNELLDKIIDNKIDKELIDNFEKEMENIKNNKVGGIMKLSTDEFKDLNNISKKYEKGINIFLENLNQFYKKYQTEIKKDLLEY